MLKVLYCCVSSSLKFTQRSSYLTPKIAWEIIVCRTIGQYKVTALLAIIEYGDWYSPLHIGAARKNFLHPSSVKLVAKKPKLPVKVIRLMAWDVRIEERTDCEDDDARVSDKDE